MWVSFDQLPDSSRIWVYQASRKLSASEIAMMEETLKDLCNSWKAHGAELHTSFSIQYSQFILLGVDESMAGASGCSIDGSVRQLKEIQSHIGIDLFDRTQVAFLSGETVEVVKMTDLKNHFLSGRLNGASLLFNNAISQKGDLKKNWLIPVEKSWLVKYLPKTTLQE